eukprot:TRINITY_DN12864_c0_g1_i1.p1 TRINITY_DN12864_c0_g1~~TRINITY_DN12864_c0_g1_i1.p1  ORF type:complete len:318 (+),score=69.84 TRINITY_DN12864_c0_g1_i1:230-1183(+)
MAAIEESSKTSGCSDHSLFSSSPRANGLFHLEQEQVQRLMDETNLFEEILKSDFEMTAQHHREELAKRDAEIVELKNKLLFTEVESRIKDYKINHLDQLIQIISSGSKLNEEVDEAVSSVEQGSAFSQLLECYSQIHSLRIDLCILEIENDEKAREILKLKEQLKAKNDNSNTTSNTDNITNENTTDNTIDDLVDNVDQIQIADNSEDSSPPLTPKNDNPTTPTKPRSNSSVIPSSAPIKLPSRIPVVKRSVSIHKIKAGVASSPNRIKLSPGNINSPTKTLKMSRSERRSAGEKLGRRKSSKARRQNNNKNARLTT